MAINPLQDRFQKAVAAHQTGNLVAAEAGYRAILKVSPKHPGTLSLLGVVLTQMGRAEDGIGFLKKAAKAAPSDDGIQFNLGNAEMAANRPDRALRAFSDAIRINPGNAGALLNRALLNEKRGRLGDAENDYRAAVALSPAWAKPAEALSILLVGQGRGAEALEAADQAIAADPTARGAQHARAVALTHVGRAEEAVDVLRAMLFDAPDPVAVRLDLANALIRSEDQDDALSVLREAENLAPTNATVLHNLAKLLFEVERPTEALAVIDRRLEDDPRDVEALYRRAMILEMVNEPDRATADTAAGLAERPGHPGLNFVGAKLDRRAGRQEDALAKLDRADATPAPIPEFPVNVAFERAHCLAELKRHDDAFAGFAHANDMAAATIDLPRAQARNQTLLGGLEALIDAGDLAKLSTSPLADGNPDPIFMVGFPRSGTTLLDRVLDAHPALTVMEEYPILVDLALGRPGYPEYLADLTDQDRLDLRAAYFREAARRLDGPAERLVDKLPLNVLHIPMIRALFPDAPIILSLRHPADAVLSCFMQNFRLNAAMSTFTALDTAARQYDQVMSLWTGYADALGIDAIEVRYEDMVEDLEAVARRVLGALDLPWDESVLGFRDQLKGRLIATPSYAQVAKPIHKAAAGRWTAYRDHLAPILPTLEPWIDRWGYSAG